MSKRLKEAKAKIDKSKVYPLAEAIKLVKDTASLKFDPTIEAHIRLNIDPKKSEQTVRDAVVLPHGSGKQVKIAAIVTDDQVKVARDAGADLVGGQDLIDTIKTTGKTDFDVLVTTPQMMKNLAVVAKTLGQKGLMPSPKAGTIDPDIQKLVKELKKGKVAYKNDDTGNIHLTIGKASFAEADLQENFKVLLESIKKNKPATLKNSLIAHIYLCSSMGPSIKVETK